MSDASRQIGTPSISNKTPDTSIPAVLPSDHLELVSAWGGASRGISHVYRPSTLEGVRSLFVLARKYGCSIGLRGGGNSYGDAAMNDENIVLDTSRLNRILNWDPGSGRIQVEPGVTLAKLWQYALEDGWWPPVVTGTMETTIGGCASMNVHGKNAWQAGPIGDHIFQFELMLPSGEIVTCDRSQNHELFYAAIGGFGMLGCFTSITLQLKRIYSGLLEVQTQTRPNLAEMLAFFDENIGSTDYIVGWIDAFARGSSLGRGDVHTAKYLPPGADPFPNQTLRLSNQHLPESILGVFPKSIIWIFMRLVTNNPGTRLVNSGKYWSGRIRGARKFRQPHAAFHFLLDYVPNWKKGYGAGGLIQYQPFIPEANAQEAFGEILIHCQKRGIPNYLTVLKRHRRDDFLMTHGLDGYSMAMDFRITERNRGRVAQLTSELDAIVLSANGRFYFAKDSTLRPQSVVAYLGEETINQFRALKDRCDPDNILQTNLWRRVFP